MRFLLGVMRQLIYIVPVLGAFYFLDSYTDNHFISQIRRHRPDLQPAPDFRLPRVQSGIEEAAATMLGLSDLKDEPVIINFWASWCTSCADEKPYLDSIWKKRKKYRNRMLGIATTDEWSKVIATGMAAPERYPVLLYRDGSVARAFGVKTLPQTIVLDPRSRILLRIEGPVHSADRVADLDRMFTADVMDAHAH